MRRPPVPAFIADLFADPTARGGLLAGSAALFAAALDPKVWGPSLPNVQAAIRERPGLEAVVLLAALGGSALLLLGGAIGDSARARRIIVGGLAVELFASVASLLLPVGPHKEAYAAGVQAALALGGLTAVVGGLIAWVALGRHDPLATVHEHRDEREAVVG